MCDTELINLIRTSPDKGMEALMDKFMGLVCSVVNARLKGICTIEDIEECTSDVFADFYCNIDKFSTEKGTLKSLLCSMARNKAINFYNKKIRESARLSLSLEDENQDFYDDFSVEEAYLNSETRRILMNEIARLGKIDYEIIVRKFFFGEASKDIGKRLNMSASNVDTRTHRALARLKEKLGGILS